MQVYTFRAGSLPEALAQVRRTLGPDATVLPASRRGDFGSAPHGCGWVEVRALPPEDDGSAGRSPPACVPQELECGPCHKPAALAAAASASVSPPGAELEDYRRKLRRDLARAGDEPSLVEHLAEAEAAKDVAARHRTRLARRLAELGIGPATCQRWLDGWQQEWVRRRPLRSTLAAGFRQADVPDAVAEEAAVQAVLRDVIAAELPIAGPLELSAQAPLVVVLAGPTGVGKTTTIAKLAARFCRQQGCRVGLVAADHYRLAAVEQLRAYAQIMEIPLELAESPAAVDAARQRLSSCDLVLVDTAGVGPRDAERLAELAALRDAASPCELALVLSATAHPQVLAEAAETFQRLGATRLVLTKLDEAAACGPLLDWLTTCPLPLSYTTAGQNVPDDLKVAAAHPLASELLQRASTAASAAWATLDAPAGLADLNGHAATRPQGVAASADGP
jgi:flagellar biosynthesis protein FlhF